MDLIRSKYWVQNQKAHATTKRGLLEYMSERFSRRSQAACAVPRTFHMIIDQYALD